MAPRALFIPCLLLALLSAAPAGARESCPFLRDPAFHARTPVAPAPAGSLAFGTLNGYRLFDDQQDRNEQTVLTARQFAARIERVARYLARDMGAPPVIALQEVEDDTVLQALTAALRRETGRAWRAVAGEVAGDGEFRSALLVADGIDIVRSQSLFARTPRDGLPLHDRLPLVVELEAGRHGRISVVVVHMKSLVGTDRPRDAERVYAKRRFQAQELAAWTRTQVQAGRRLVLLGDFNATPPAPDDPRSEPLQILLADGGMVDAAPRFLRPSQRWTYRYRCLLQQLDHVLVSPALAPAVDDYAIARGDTCIRAREKCDATLSVSDHEGVVLRLR